MSIDTFYNCFSTRVEGLFPLKGIGNRYKNANKGTQLGSRKDNRKSENPVPRYLTIMGVFFFLISITISNEVTETGIDLY